MRHGVLIGRRDDEAVGVEHGDVSYRPVERHAEGRAGQVGDPGLDGAVALDRDRLHGVGPRRLDRDHRPPCQAGEAAQHMEQWEQPAVDIEPGLRPVPGRVQHAERSVVPPNVTASAPPAAKRAKRPSVHAAPSRPRWRGSLRFIACRMLAGFGIGASPYGLWRMPMALGPTANGFVPAMARALAAMAGNDSRPSMTEWSSPARIVATVVKLTRSTRPTGGRLRFISVK